jgi:hypothetical protein
LAPGNQTGGERAQKAEHSAVASRPSELRRAVKGACVIEDEAGGGQSAVVRGANKAVEHGLDPLGLPLAKLRQLEQGAFIADSAGRRRAVKGAPSVANEAPKRSGTVIAAKEDIENSLGPLRLAWDGRRQLEDCAKIRSYFPSGRRAIKRAVLVEDQPSHRKSAVAPALEVVQHGLGPLRLALSRRRQLEDSAKIRSYVPSERCAIERAICRRSSQPKQERRRSRP